MLAALIAAAALTAQPTPGSASAQPETTPTNDTARADSVHPDPRVDQLLTELEAADEGLRDLHANILYVRHDITLESVVTRMGTLRYIAEGKHDEPKVFSVLFDSLIDDMNRKSDNAKRWAFDGRWLVEQDFANKTFIQREVAREGDNRDPMALGEGPLPIPIGQKKQAIIERYAVEMPDAVTEGLEPPADGFTQDVARNFRDAVASRTQQLRLVPRVPDPEGFDEIRLWYTRTDATDNDTGRHVPMLARAVKLDRQGNESDVAYIWLYDVQINTGIDRDTIGIGAPPQGEGWAIDIRRLPRPESPAPNNQGS